jgi:hypothetical protein
MEADYSVRFRTVDRIDGAESSSNGRFAGKSLNPSLRARLKSEWGPAARDFGRDRGGEAGASPKRAVTAEPTKSTPKRTAARRVFAEKAGWLRCSSVTDPFGVCSFVAPRHPAFSAKTGSPLTFQTGSKGTGRIADVSAGETCCGKGGGRGRPGLRRHVVTFDAPRVGEPISVGAPTRGTDGRRMESRDKTPHFKRPALGPAAFPGTGEMGNGRPRAVDGPGG